MAIRLRPATPHDSVFCFDLHARAMGPVIVERFGVWDEEVQQGLHERWFNLPHVQIIENDEGSPIGVLDVRDEGDEVYLSRIELLPEHQGHGIGGALIRSLLAPGRPVRLHVFSENTRALGLYERLGFLVEGEADGRVAMIARP